MKRSEMQCITDTTEQFFLGNPGKELEQFNDAKQAGAAFYSAAENLRPYVIHKLPDGSARMMASTSLHGHREDKTIIFVKSFPCGAYTADAVFISGYREAEARAKALFGS